MAKKPVNVASKRVNPKNFKKMGKIIETEDGGFGDYDETLGGGSPKGGLWGGRDGRVGWQERIESGEVGKNEKRTEQPRTSDGKFTYNSANGKETKYDGRGKTVNPLLTGGENGIKIEDVKKQFESKSGALYDKFKDKFVQKGSEKIALKGKKFKTQISSENFYELASKGYDAKTGTFKGEEEAWSTKSGRISAQERQAMGEAGKTKKEQYVRVGTGTADDAKAKYDPTQAIKVKGDTSAQNAARTNAKVSKAQDMKHSQSDIAGARKQLESMGVDTSDFTDEQIDNMLTEQGL